ncbi:hypothetical protein K474DRAFT_1685243 [Panus rudis PR-1116 ss-1]|nr:hypothetical protein K474DRAFT_1685243 [Panus rudis PR-1116 ss-1]
MDDKLDYKPNTDTSSSLLSLSIAAASAAPIPTPSGTANGSNGGNIATAKLHAHAPQKHRRPSSSGIMRRRLSDAREAASRPSPATIQSAAAALSSLATLSLSGSPPPAGTAAAPQLSTSFSAASSADAKGTIAANSPLTESNIKQEDADHQASQNGNHTTAPAGKGEVSVGGISIKNTGTGKKRGTIFKCESCSKHSPHWREASKFLLSKHQQVQLLEAAAILSHISPSATGGTSLPEDRALWPSFLSGGALPPPSPANLSSNSADAAAGKPSSLEIRQSYPVSSSVPANTVHSNMTRSGSTGPRMHDYSVPVSRNGLTHVRPGVLAVPTPTVATTGPDQPSMIIPPPETGARPMPVPLPVNHTTYREPTAVGGSVGGGYSYVSGTSAESWGSPSISHTHSYTGGVNGASSYVGSYGGPHSFGDGYPHSYGDGAPHSYGEGAQGAASYGTGRWSSLRSSSVLSTSISISDSRSRSGSLPRSASEVGYEDEYVDIDDDDGRVGGRYGFVSRGRTSSARDGDDDDGSAVKAKKIEEEQWDGMEMEMEM